jgi:TonB family protein
MYVRRTLQSPAARTDQPGLGWLGTLGAMLGTVGAHVFVFFALGAVRVDASAPRPGPVEFEVFEAPPVAEPELEAPPPEPEPEPEPVKPPPKVREASPRPVEEAPKPDATPPAAAEETLADFSGTTLTAEGAGGWSSVVGSGGEMKGPIGKAGAAVTGRNREGVEGGVVGGTGLRVVGEADLSRRPKAPGGSDLNDALKREYPKQAQLQGIGGVARIRVRVMPTGKLSPLATLSESYPGFADACKRSLKNARFEPALDRSGLPVATDINYACEFEVD